MINRLVSSFRVIRSGIVAAGFRVERAFCMIAAANHPECTKWVQNEGGTIGELRPQTPEEWAATVKKYGDALRKELQQIV